jgi:hypothetical protein
MQTATHTSRPSRHDLYYQAATLGTVLLLLCSAAIF